MKQVHATAEKLRGDTSNAAWSIKYPLLNAEIIRTGLNKITQAFPFLLNNRTEGLRALQQLFY